MEFDPNFDFSGGDAYINNYDPFFDTTGFSRNEPGGEPPDGIQPGQNPRPRKKKMDYYQQLGNAVMQAIQPQQQGPQEAGGYMSSDLTSGFDRNWLMTQTNAGSANGAHL